MNTSHIKPTQGDLEDVGPPLRLMHLGQHLLAGLLLVVGVIRAIAMGDDPTMTIATALIFTAIYWYPVLLRKPEHLTTKAWFIVVSIAWVGSLWASEEFTWLAFLLWLIAGQVFSLPTASAYSLIVFTLVVIAPYAHSGSTTYAAVIGPLVGAIFALAISRGYLILLHDAQHRRDLLTSLHQAHADTAALQDELALTQRHAGKIAERTRLAQEIHDTVAQDLASTLLFLRTALEQNHNLGETLQQTERVIARASRDIREIITALTPSDLADQALPTAITRLSSRFKDHLHINLHLEDIPPLSVEKEVALLRTCQSALSNVQRHSKATRVAISLSTAGDTVLLDIRDNGQGFNPGSSQGYGLRLMNERLRSLEGTLEIESTPGAGTALSATLPIISRTP